MIFFFNNTSLSVENKILVKIENQIITSLDLNNEYKYLIALNPGLKKSGFKLRRENNKDTQAYVVKTIILTTVRRSCSSSLKPGFGQTWVLAIPDSKCILWL